MSYHYKSAHFTRVLKYCKSDQVLESHYQWLEDVLRQEKYEIIAIRYDLKYRFLQSIVLKRNVREEK